MTSRKEERPLAGRRAWVITDGKVGMDTQVKGVADALGVAYEAKRVDPKGIWRHLAPWGPVAPSEQFGQPGSLFAPPFPAVALATGRQSIPYIRALKRLARAQTFTVVLQDPKTGPKTADLIWVPAHDSRRGTNVITTLTAPHSFTMERLSELRAEAPDWLAGLPGPRIAVILGGKNGVYRFTDEDDDRFERALAAFGALGASFMCTPSRRTHQRLIRAVARATEGRPRFLWDGKGENPYPHMLAHADLLVVTADSVNMTGEAAATGRPVHVFFPSGGSAKFQRFHDSLRHYGATRPLPDAATRIEEWSYRPLDSARAIAAEIEMRWQRRVAMLSGLAGATS